MNRKHNRFVRAAIRTGDAPLIEVRDRSLVYRERVFIPLWVTFLQRIFAGAWRLLVRLLRLLVRHPIASLALAGLVALYGWAGRAGLVVLAAVVFVVGAVWRWRWPGSFDRQVTRRARSWRRWRWVYRRRWVELMDGCGLVETTDAGQTFPQIASLVAAHDRDDLILRLPAGQVPDDVTESADAIAHGLGAWRVTTRPDSPGRVGLMVLWTDPLAHSIYPADLDLDAPDGGRGTGGDGPDGGPGRTRRLVTAASVLARLSAVPVGITEAGRDWTLTLLPGRHLLVAGSTGSGKSGLLWATLWALRDLITAGWIQVTALDPKYVELRAVASSRLGTVVTDVPSMPGVLENLVDELNSRCDVMTGRTHLPSPTSPVRVVIIDELATLTALSDTKSKARVEQALGHLLSRGRAAGFLVVLTSVEATKEVVRWRGLCSNRVCYRTDDDQADLVLGDGAHDNGARTELICEDTPGVAYTRTEGRAGIDRVRTLHVTDDHLDALRDAATFDARDGLDDRRSAS